MQGLVFAWIVLVAAEGLLGAAAPDFHVVHAPVKGTEIHCHHGAECPETHFHLGRP